MENKKGLFGKIRRIFAESKELPKSSVIIPVIVYFLLYICTMFTSGSDDVLMVGSAPLPVSSLTGAFASLSSICLVIMVLYYKKTGLIIAIAAISTQLPRLLIWVFVSHNLTGISGLFSSLFTIIMIVIIYVNHVRMDKEQKRLRNLFEQTATALVNAIDAKDKYTHGHSARVADYARRLAEMNHKSPEECDEIYYAALLHDVGKIGVPEYIINKKGKLTPEEYETIKSHAALGRQILQSISEYPYLSIGAGSHHERFDGKGYPFKLKGTDIPEIARIISVADAYDAMSSARSYRAAIPQQLVREELVKGSGTQFDPVYARLMLHLIDIDPEYKMSEREEVKQLAVTGELTSDKFRSAVSEGIHIIPNITTVHLTVTPDEPSSGKTPVPAMVLFDAIDGRVHESEKEKDELCYFEYGEIWFDGRTNVRGARKMQTNITKTAQPESLRENEYRIEAVKRKDHVLIRIAGREQTAEIIAALPDSTRFAYIGLTGEHCRISGVRKERSAEEAPADLIPRIAEEISFINVPAGDMPNVQIDGYRTDASQGIEIRDGLRISFHSRTLPAARLVWHCPFIDIFCSDDGRVNGKNYLDLAFMRFDGEFWECDPCCQANLGVKKSADFMGWESWKEFNLAGFDTVVTFAVSGNKITITTENAGISMNCTAVISGTGRKIYAAVTGDQIAVTNIRVS